MRVVCVCLCVSHKSLVFSLMPFCANALESVTNPTLTRASGSSLSFNSTSGTTSWRGGGERLEVQCALGGGELRVETVHLGDN